MDKGRCPRCGKVTRVRGPGDAFPGTLCQCTQDEYRKDIRRLKAELQFHLGFDWELRDDHEHLMQSADWEATKVNARQALIKELQRIASEPYHDDDNERNHQAFARSHLRIQEWLTSQGVV